MKTGWIITGIALAAFILTILFLKGMNGESISIAANIIVVVAAISFFRRRYPERYKKDERTIKLSSYAASWSWLATLITVALLFWIDYLGIYTLAVGQIISIIMFVMIITLVIFRWHFERKGDIQ